MTISVGECPLTLDDVVRFARSSETVELARVARDVVPVVPRIGSISVADLPQLAHLMLPLVGEGEAYSGGERMSGREALGRADLAPATLGAKDGIALISANAATVGRAALVV